MATVTFKGTPVHTSGNLPKVGQKIKADQLVKNDLSVVSLADYQGKRKVLSIFPSIDTGVCASSVRQFNKLAGQLKNTVVLNLSLDLPFANARFCGAEGIQNCETLSGFRSNFGTENGLILTESVLAGLYARAILILSETNELIYSELVSEITHEPNYEAALLALGK